MPSNPRVGRFTFPGLTVAAASGYTGYIGSRERITPMNENNGIAAVEHVATGLHENLVTEFQSPLGSVDMVCEWVGEDFHKIIFATPAESLFIFVTSVVGEEGADVRVVVFDSETFKTRDLLCSAHVRELGRVARALKAIPCVDSVQLDAVWERALLVSVRSEGADS